MVADDLLGDAAGDAVGLVNQYNLGRVQVPSLAVVGAAGLGLYAGDLEGLGVILAPAGGPHAMLDA